MSAAGELEEGLETVLRNMLDSYENGEAFETEFLETLDDLEAAGAIDPDVAEVLSRHSDEIEDFFNEIKQSDDTGDDIVSAAIQGGFMGFAEEFAKANAGLSVTLVEEIREKVVQEITIKRAIIEFFEDQPIKIYYDKVTGMLVRSETVLSETTHIPLGKMITGLVKSLNVAAIVDSYRDTMTDAYNAATNPDDITLAAEAFSTYMKTGGAAVLGFLAERAAGGGISGGVVGGVVISGTLYAAEVVENAIAQTMLGAYNLSKTAEEMFDDVSEAVSEAFDNFMNATGQAAADMLEGAETAINDLYDGLEQLADDYGWAARKALEGLADWVQGVAEQVEAASTMVSPLVLDLGEQGIDLSGTVYWDIDQDGMAEATAWTSGEDGLLAYDRNGDGAIDNHGELFGTEVDDGFLRLAEFDTNGDGVIDANDTAFNDLIVWVDANSDGYSQEWEMFSLTDLGITEINLNAAANDNDISILRKVA